jgi:D-sedoheptulose 7-phosphate isomerase
MTVAIDPLAAEFADYSARLQGMLARADLANVAVLARAMRECWRAGSSIYLCGNGGSAGNAVHLANDLVHGIAKDKGLGMRAHALPANTSILTCLANDIAYSEIFAAQIKVYARPGDLLLALSGSGNSPNILRAIEAAKALRVKTFAVLGYSGGKAKEMVDVAIHFPIDDMQIAEDLQLVVGHMIMQWLHRSSAN